ncbi:hypothetical protein QJT91_25100, partial [Bordetella bronchiseptica]
ADQVASFRESERRRRQAEASGGGDGVGALLALYEHKAFVQAALWGAALGGADQAQACQRLAQDIARQLAVPPAAGPVDWGHDSSTAFWIDRYREQGGAGAAAGRTA